MLVRLCFLIALVTVGALPAESQDSAGIPPVVTPKNQKDWKRLRHHAKSPQEYRVVADWCEAQSEQYDRKVARYENELRRYRENAWTAPASKYQSKEQSLKVAIWDSQIRSTHWRDLAKLYSARAQ